MPSGGGGGGGGAGAAAMPAAPPPGLPGILLQELPRLLDAPPGKVAELLLQKLEVASVTGLNWGTAEADRQAKDVKLRTLSELVDFMGSPQNQKHLTEALYEPCVGMVCANIFRSLPMPKQSVEEATGASGGSGGEGGDDSDPPLEPAWTHLHLVYEFLLRFILSAEVKSKLAKKWVDAAFCAKLVELFESDDPREREYLKVRVCVCVCWRRSVLPPLPLPVRVPLPSPCPPHPQHAPHPPPGRPSCTASMASS